MNNNIIVIVVTYNAQRWIEKCLNSIASSTIKATIMVVDNNSTDDTLNIIERSYTEVILLKNLGNMGFAKGNNLGIKYALEKGFNYIALLNQDAKLNNHTLEKLIYYSSIYSDYGILAPLTFNYDGDALDPYHVAKSFSSNLKLASDVYFHREKDVYDIELAPAAIWLMKADAIREVGGFDPLFFMYGEDNDLWDRFRLKGWKTGIFPIVIAYHHHDSNAWRKPEKRILYAYSEFVLQLKNPQNNFLITFFKIEIKNAFLIVYSLMTLNILNFKIFWHSNSKLLVKLVLIYKHRKICINHNSPFL